MPVIVLDGIMGTGKSTVAEALCKKLGAKHFPERYLENEYLPMYYNGELNQYGIARMQHRFASLAQENLSNAFSYVGFHYRWAVVEMSPHFNVNVYGKQVLENEVNPFAFKLLSSQYPLLNYRELDICQIKLQANTDTIMRRIQRRGRQDEVNTQLPLEVIVDQLNIASHYYGRPVAGWEGELKRSCKSYMGSVVNAELPISVVTDICAEIVENYFDTAE